MQLVLTTTDDGEPALLVMCETRKDAYRLGRLEHQAQSEGKLAEWQWGQEPFCGYGDAVQMLLPLAKRPVKGNDGDGRSAGT